MATVEDLNPTGGARAWGGSSRLQYKAQTVDDRYGLPENFLEVEVVNPVVHGEGRNRYIDYEVRMVVSTKERVCGAERTHACARECTRERARVLAREHMRLYERTRVRKNACACARERMREGKRNKGDRDRNDGVRNARTAWRGAAAG